MAVEWYYTTNKQQMGPVSWEELCQLATKHLLKPDDLVWTEGMAEWVKAIRQQGLFQASAAPATAVISQRAETPEAPPRKSSARQRIDDELDEIDDEQRRQRRKARKGSGTGLKIGLIVGTVVFVMLVLSCGLGITLVIVFWNPGGPGGQPAGGGVVVGGGANLGGAATYNLNLAQGRQDSRVFTFRGGQNVTITVTTDRAQGAPQPLIAVQVLQGGRAIATMRSNNAVFNHTFNAPADGGYQIRVQNQGPGAARTRVDIR